MVGDICALLSRGTIILIDCSTNTPTTVGVIAIAGVTLTRPVAWGSSIITTSQAGTGTLYRFDISTPSSPVLSASGSMAPGSRFAMLLNVAGNYIVATSMSGILTANPLLIWRADTLAYHGSITLSSSPNPATGGIGTSPGLASRFVVASSTAVDVIDAASLSVVGTLATSSGGRVAVDAAGTTAVTYGGVSSNEQIDLTNPVAPAVIDTQSVLYPIAHGFIADGYFYTHLATFGPLASTLTQILYHGFADVTSTNSVYPLSGGRMLLVAARANEPVAGHAFMQILDRPTTIVESVALARLNPNATHNSALGRFARRLVGAGLSLWVGTHSILTRFNMAVSPPVETARFDISSTGWTASATHAFSLSGSLLRAHDATGSIVGTVVVPSGLSALEMHPNGTHLLGIGGNQFRIIDISNPAAMSVVGSLSFTTGTTRAVTANATYMFVVTTTRFIVVNIVNPAAPVLTASVVQSDVFDRLFVNAAGTRVFNGGAGVGVNVWDVSTPATPTATLIDAGVEDVVGVTGTTTILVSTLINGSPAGPLRGTLRLEGWREYDTATQTFTGNIVPVPSALFDGASAIRNGTSGDLWVASPYWVRSLAVFGGLSTPLAYPDDYAGHVDRGAPVSAGANSPPLDGGDVIIPGAHATWRIDASDRRSAVATSAVAGVRSELAVAAHGLVARSWGPTFIVTDYAGAVLCRGVIPTSVRIDGIAPLSATRVLAVCNHDTSSSAARRMHVIDATSGAILSSTTLPHASVPTWSAAVVDGSNANVAAVRSADSRPNLYVFDPAAPGSGTTLTAFGISALIDGTTLYALRIGNNVAVPDGELRVYDASNPSALSLTATITDPVITGSVRVFPMARDDGMIVVGPTPISPGRLVSTGEQQPLRRYNVADGTFVDAWPDIALPNAFSGGSTHLGDGHFVTGAARIAYLHTR